MAIVYFRLGNARRASKPNESLVLAGNYCIENMPGMNTVDNVCSVIDEYYTQGVKDRIERIWMQYDGGSKTVVDMHTGKQLTTKNELSEFAEIKLTASKFSTRPVFPFGSARFLRHGH